MKKLLFLSLLVLFSCSKAEEEEEVRIPTKYVDRLGVSFSVVYLNSGPNHPRQHPYSSSPWMLIPYWSNETQIAPLNVQRNSQGNVITLNRVECFSTWDLKLPETPEGYEFVRWEMSPFYEAVPTGEYPNFTKYVNCVDFPVDSKHTVMVTAVYLYDN